ncbi:hypothetical protein SERLA73DRAFT_151288 [Serpula lacrymans var. lacrymans S7.3]|uniref:Uncharacterized protein n=1 Tax=Serpula lacrymans var. lacrymans (strain S7.3) TaxID=936435 RepID=F8PTK5_SERL3|nr:hypothetical protein SERLA73DRAFT_151288 [Serpula lacrymans var. lacrymans S7.3]
MTSGGGFNFSFTWGWNRSLACRLSPRVTQHAFKGLHRNIKPEIFWSQLQKRWSPGFEILMDEGLNNGLYNPNNALERASLIILLIASTQHALVATRTRFFPRVVLTTFFDSQHVGTQVISWSTYIVLSSSKCARIPPAFHELASTFLSDAGNPLVTMNMAWDVYSMLLDHFHLHDQKVLQTMMRSEPVSRGDGRPDLDFIAIVDFPPYRPRLHDKAQGFAAGHLWLGLQISLQLTGNRYRRLLTFLMDVTGTPMNQRLGIAPSQPAHWVETGSRHLANQLQAPVKPGNTNNTLFRIVPHHEDMVPEHAVDDENCC